MRRPCCLPERLLLRHLSKRLRPNSGLRRQNCQIGKIPCFLSWQSDFFDYFLLCQWTNLKWKVEILLNLVWVVYVFENEITFLLSRRFSILLLQLIPKDLDHTSYLSFFLHEQNFWRIKFTPKKCVNYDKIHRKLQIFCVITAKYTVNCQFFALNL